MADKETEYDSSGLLNSSFYSSETINALDHSRTFRHSLVLKELSDSSLNMALRLGGNTDNDDDGGDNVRDSEGKIKTNPVPGEVRTKNMSNSPSLSALADILNDKARRAEQKMKLKIGLEASTIMEREEEEDQEQRQEQNKREERVGNKEESKEKDNSSKEKNGVTDGVSSGQPGSHQNDNILQTQAVLPNYEHHLANQTKVKSSEALSNTNTVPSAPFHLDNESATDFDASFHTAFETRLDIHGSGDPLKVSLQPEVISGRPNRLSGVERDETSDHEKLSDSKAQGEITTDERMHSRRHQSHQRPPPPYQKVEASHGHQIERPKTSTGWVEHRTILNNDVAARRQRASSLGNLVTRNELKYNTQNITRRESSESVPPGDSSIKKKRGIFSFLKKKKNGETSNSSQVSLPHSSHTNASVHSFSSNEKSKKIPIKSVSSNSIFNTFRRKTPSGEKQNDSHSKNITTKGPKPQIPSDQYTAGSASLAPVSLIATNEAATNQDQISQRSKKEMIPGDEVEAKPAATTQHRAKGNKRNATPLNFELQLNYKESERRQTLAPTPTKPQINPQATIKVHAQNEAPLQPRPQISTPVIAPNKECLSDSAGFGSTPMSQTTSRSKRRDSGEVFFPKSLDADEIDSIIQIERNRSIRSLNNAANRRPFDVLSEKAENDGMVIMEVSGAVISTPDLGKSPANSILKNGRFSSYGDTEPDSLLSPDGHFETYDTRSASLRVSSGLSGLNASANSSPGVINSYSVKSIEEKLNKLDEQYSNETDDESSNRLEYIENIDDDGNDEELMGDIMEFAQLIDFGNEIDFGHNDIDADIPYKAINNRYTYMVDNGRFANSFSLANNHKKASLDRSTSLSNSEAIRYSSKDIQKDADSPKKDPAGLGLNFASSPLGDIDEDDDDDDFRGFVEDGGQVQKNFIVLPDGISPERHGAYDDFENEDFNDVEYAPPAPIQEQVDAGTPELSPNMNRYIEESMVRPISMSFKGLINEYPSNNDNLSTKDEHFMTENETTVGRKVKFSSKVLLYETYSEFEYDRNPDISTCNQLTPQLAQMIKAELNELKSTMEVHEASRCYTQFF